MYTQDSLNTKPELTLSTSVSPLSPSYQNRDDRLYREKVIGQVRGQLSSLLELSNLKQTTFKWQRCRKLGKWKHQMIGVSLNEPNTSVTALCTRVCLLACLWPLTTWVLLRLRDTKWGVVCAPNSITRSVQSHLTTAAKDGVQIERHFMRIHSHKE